MTSPLFPDTSICEGTCPPVSIETNDGTITLPAQLQCSLLNGDGLPAFQSNDCADTFSTPLTLAWFMRPWNALNEYVHPTPPSSTLGTDPYRLGFYIGRRQTVVGISVTCGWYICLSVFANTIMYAGGSPTDLGPGAWNYLRFGEPLLPGGFVRLAPAPSNDFTIGTNQFVIDPGGTMNPVLLSYVFDPGFPADPPPEDLVEVRIEPAA